jgi:hypothetical protein
MKPHLALFLVAGSLFATAIQAAPPGPDVQFTAHGVVARGVSPNAQVVFFGVGSIPFPARYLRRIVRWHQVVSDHGADGSVTFDLGQDMPPESVWVVADLTNGQYTLVRPTGATGHVPIRGGSALRQHGNTSDTFAFNRRNLDLLYIHPGHGAWAWTALAGSPGNAEVSETVTSVSATTGTPLAGSDKLASFVPGGILVAVDNHTLEVQITRVSGSGGLQ